MIPIENVLSSADLSALVQTAGELAMKIDLKDLLELILVKSGEMTNSPDAAIILYNPERKSLFFAGAIGKDGSMLMEKFGESAEAQIPIDKSIAGKVFITMQSIIIDSVKEADGHYKGVDEKTNRPTERMLCVPLIASGECLGAMQILNKDSGNYNLRDQILLEQFGSYASVAIRNARLFEELAARMGLYGSQEVSGSVADLINELKSPAKTETLTVLFADMRGFRRLCQTLNRPDKTLAILNEFITMLSEQVVNYGGLVNKFLGDGILALFRQTDHAQRAVRCAFSMVDKFKILRDSWNHYNEQLDFLDIGLGITTDDLIIGAVGNSKVKDFTVIGTAVNLAAAFEKDARNGKRILVDQITYSAAKEIVAEIEGPFNYELRNPDQPTGNTFKQYHLKKLAKDIKDTVFISHSKFDREFVEKELIALFTKNEITPWYSNEDIIGGESWIKSINKGLDKSNWVIVIISKSSATSEWVSEEIDMAAARQHLRNRIIPLTLDDTKLEEVNPFLLHKQAVDVRNASRFPSEIIATIKSSKLKT
jgi:adenylate cyclase